MTTRPLIAILIGVHPDEAVAVVEVLLDAGFADIEVPLNSPKPLTSIARLVGACGGTGTTKDLLFRTGGPVVASCCGVEPQGSGWDMPPGRKRDVQGSMSPFG